MWDGSDKGRNREWAKKMMCCNVNEKKMCVLPLKLVFQQHPNCMILNGVEIEFLVGFVFWQRMIIIIIY
jgi:hypothetical protein